MRPICIKGLDTLARKLVYHEAKEVVKADHMTLLLYGETLLSFDKRTQLDWICSQLKAIPCIMTVKQASEIIWIYWWALVVTKLYQFIMWTKGASYNV